ncbi:phage head closure protein [Maritalea sp.]|uniref:phage head closure protein n=1 Tax=Maritalea sp. TaxID=2003361 RepID=UPI003EFB0F7E
MNSQTKRAGALNHRVAFEKKSAQSDGAGGTTGEFEEQFRCAANVIHQRGGEAVMAGRLAGRATVIITVRKSSAHNPIDGDWRAVDVRSGELFNIRSITPSADRMWLDYLCESGVAVN